MININSNSLLNFLETLRIPVSTARNIISKYKETGNYLPAPRSGRPSSLSQREISYLCYSVRKYQKLSVMVSQKLSEMVNKNLNRQISAC